jgi:GT2 family glycosyltransferase
MHLATAPAPPDVPPPAPALREARPGVLAPDLSVIIVNYRRWQDTAALLRQLRASPVLRRGAAEVVVVDNHSPAHPLVRRLRRWPGVSLRRWGRNRGFARAANEGCRLSRGRWLLLLNPDVTLPDDFLEAAVGRAQQLAAADPRAGVVGFGLRHADGTPQLSCGPFPTLAGSLARLALPRARRKYHALPPGWRRRVPWVTGCCLLVRADCFREVGGLDDDFFLYYEDVDFCRRASAAGWSVWYDPAVTVTHHNPLHTRAVPPHLRVFTRHALLTYAGKHWPAWQFRALAGLVRLAAALRRRLAAWQGDATAAAAFAALGAVAADLAGGRPQAARRRLDRLVRRREAALAP